MLPVSRIECIESCGMPMSAAVMARLAAIFGPSVAPPPVLNYLKFKNKVQIINLNLLNHKINIRIVLSCIIYNKIIKMLDELDIHSSRCDKETSSHLELARSLSCMLLLKQKQILNYKEYFF